MWTTTSFYKKRNKKKLIVNIKKSQLKFMGSLWGKRSCKIWYSQVRLTDRGKKRIAVSHDGLRPGGGHCTSMRRLCIYIAVFLDPYIDNLDSLCDISPVEDSKTGKCIWKCLLEESGIRKLFKSGIYLISISISSRMFFNVTRYLKKIGNYIGRS